MNWKSLKARAGVCPRKLVFLHTAVAVGGAFVLSVLDLILMRQVDQTGGLSGMQARAVLESVRVILQYAITFLLPFWELGFTYTVLRLARGQQADPGSFLEGFRRFGPAFRLMLLRAVLYITIAMACLNVSIMVFTLTPLSGELNRLLDSLMARTQDVQVLMEQLPVAQMQKAILPGIVLFAVIYGAVMVPLLYRLRLAELAVMDKPGTGAFAAVKCSNQAMRGNAWSLFRVDLRFWWFYLLQILVAALCYGDTLLRLAGVQIPVSEDVGFFLFYSLYAVCQLALHTLFWGRVQTTYALIYDQLKEQV